MNAHMDKIQEALKNMPSIKSFIRSTSGTMPFKDATSHTLVRIEPVKDSDWKRTETELISEYISNIVFEHIRLHEAANISESIMGLLRSPDARGYGGKLFEQAVHRKFRAGCRFEPQPLTEGAPRIFIDILKVDKEADGYFYTLSVRAKKGSRDVHAKYLNQYLIPVSKTQESVDAVWMSNECTAFLQMTVSPQHAVKLLEITTLTNELPFNATQNVCIVFVVPKGDKSTLDFKPQSIVYPVGTLDDVVKKVLGYPQYVFYFDLDSVN
jgi:hypothetical protein